MIRYKTATYTYMLVFIISLAWLLPLSSSLYYGYFNIWDPTSHYMNYQRIIHGAENTFNLSWFLSERLGALWQMLCPSTALSYWWFYFGGCVITAFSNVMLTAAFARLYELSGKAVLLLGIVSSLTIFLPIYLYIGYGTVPMLLLVIELWSFVNLLKEKSSVGSCVILGFLGPLGMASRLNMTLMLPLSLACIILIGITRKTQKLFAFLAYWGIGLIVSSMILGIIIWNYQDFPQSIISENSGNFAKQLICEIRFYAWWMLLMTVFAIPALTFGRLVKRYLDKSAWSAPYVYLFPASAISIFMAMAYLSDNLQMSYLYLWLFPLLPLTVSLSRDYAQPRGKNNVLLVGILILASMIVFAFGSNIKVMVFTLFCGCISCFFTGQLYISFQDKPTIRHGLLLSLVLMNILVAIWIGSGMDIRHGKRHLPIFPHHAINIGVLHGLLIEDKTTRDEYVCAVATVQKHIKFDDTSLEFIPAFHSRLIPATVAAGCVPVFSFWTNRFKETGGRFDHHVILPKLPTHILIWEESSSLYYPPIFDYPVDIPALQQSLLKTDQYELVEKQQAFRLYSLKR